MKPSATRPGRVDERVFFLGLTGSPGAGKSEAVKYFRSKGIPVLSADDLGHPLLRRPDLRKRLVRRFGRTILGPGGEILRSRLASAAFRNPRDARSLNRLLHPAIRREVEKRMRALERRRPHTPLVVVEAALLHEGGWAPLFDGIVCVSAPSPVRRVRLKKRGWSFAEILRRERMQWSGRRKEQQSDWVVANGGTRMEFRVRLENWWKSRKI